MGRCWSCGSQVHGVRYLFTCPTCEGVSVMKDIRSGAQKSAAIEARGMEMLASGLSELTGAVSRVSEELSDLASVVEWGFEEIKWELRQQTQILISIDKTLKTPSQTQAREWRIMAEKLRQRACLDEAEGWFLKALRLNPLDYRIYIGLAMTCLRKNDFDKARDALMKSLPHAPRCKRVVAATGSEIELALRNAGRPTSFDLPLGAKSENLNATLQSCLGLEKLDDIESADLWMELLCTEEHDLRVSGFDYRSQSFRLLGRIYACQEDYTSAASALRSAIQFSPEYPEGNYEYAQYSVMSSSGQGEWPQCLRRAILASPDYWYMAKAERNFTPARREVESLLSTMRQEARHSAVSAIGEAEQRLCEAREAIFRLPTDHLDALETSLRPAVENLAEAKMAAASRDYRKLVSASPRALRATGISEQVKQQAISKSWERDAARAASLLSALKTIPGSLGITLGISLLVCFLVSVATLVITGSKDSRDVYGTVGLFLGLLGGVLFGIWRFWHEVQGK